MKRIEITSNSGLVFPVSKPVGSNWLSYALRFGILQLSDTANGSPSIELTGTGYMFWPSGVDTLYARKIGPTEGELRFN